MEDSQITMTTDSDIREAGQFFIAATFDGMPRRCFLDSGATTTSVKKDSAFSRYTSLREMQFMGINGDASVASRILVEDVQLGGSSLGRHEIARFPDEEAYHFTVGVDLLSTQKVLFDFKDLRFHWNPAMKTGAPFNLGKRGHLLLPVSFGKSDRQMIWDTGAGLTTLDQKVIEEQPDDFVFIRNIEVGNTVGSGATLMKLYKAKIVRASGITLKDVLVLATDFSHVQTKIGDSSVVGALGFNALRDHKWYFDVPNLKFHVE